MASDKLQTASPNSEPLPPMPIEPSWIKDGNPVACGTVLTQSADKKVSSGLWSCEPGKFEWTFGWDEFVHVLEGEVILLQDPEPRTAGQAHVAGAGLLFPGHDAQQRRLAGAVGADDAVALARVELQVDVLEEDLGPVGLAEVVHRDHDACEE